MLMWAEQLEGWYKDRKIKNTVWYIFLWKKRVDLRWLQRISTLNAISGVVIRSPVSTWARCRSGSEWASRAECRVREWWGGVHSQHNSPQTAARRRREYRDCRARRCVVLWGEVRTAQHVVARPALIAIARPWLIGQATSRRPAGRLLARHTTRAEQAVWFWRQVSVSSGAFTYKVSIN